MLRLTNMGLRAKTFIYVGAGLAALVVLLTLLSLQAVNQGIEIVSKQKLSVAETIASNIDVFVQHLRSETTNVASTLASGDNWQNDPTDSDSRERLAWLRNHMQRHLASFQQIDIPVFVTLLDAQGKVLQTAPLLQEMEGRSLSDIPAVSAVLRGERLYTEVEESILTGNSPTLSVVAQIRNDQGVVSGLIVVDIPANPGSFDSLLQRRGVEYNLTLLNESGLVLTSSGARVNMTQSPHWGLIRSLAEERLPGIKEHTGDEETQAHIVAFAPLEEVPWAVVLEESKDEILELPRAMGRRLLISGGLALLVAAALIWGFTRQIIAPVQRLAVAAERFGSGDLETKIPLTRHDEIGRLAQSFETMRHQLKRSLDEINRWNQELEQRVKERTAELESLYEKLRLRDKERGDLLGKVITAQEEERRRIARELHDDISQTLTGLVMNLGGAENLLTSDPDTARQALESFRQAASEAVNNTRRLIRDLRPSLLDDLGLMPAISWYVENYLAPAGVDAKLEVYGMEERLPPTVEIALFRVVQEAITNIVKHAQAGTAQICLNFAPSAIVGDISDDGIGFNPEAVRRGKRKGMGLLGMAERMELLNGILKVESKPGKGTRIHFEIPRQERDG